MKHNAHVVFLNGGGMDSLVALAHLASLFKTERIHPVHFDYGQLAAPSELAACRMMQEFYHTGSVAQLVLPMIGANSMGHRVEGVAGVMKPWLPHFVPNRNMIQIAHAASYAMQRKIREISGGWQDGDTDCPDVQETWLSVMQVAIQLGNALPDFYVYAPLSGMTKMEIKVMGDRYTVPWEISWSCFVGEKLPCGNCAACQRRERVLGKEMWDVWRER